MMGRYFCQYEKMKVYLMSWIWLYLKSSALCMFVYKYFGKTKNKSLLAPATFFDICLIYLFKKTAPKLGT